MSERREMTDELMRRLENDPVFQERRREKERKRLERQQEYNRLLEPVLGKLRGLGLSGESLQEIVRKFAPLSPDAAQVLLSALPEIEAERAQESIVRALGAAVLQRFDGRPLVECLKGTRDEALKWAVVNTIALTHPHSIDDWLAAIRGTPWEETLRQLAPDHDMPDRD
jgi:hypothetical protein